MKIAILGYGKMGKIIEQIANAQGHQIILKISSRNLHELKPENLTKVDVAIEFSRPEFAFANISACLESGIPVVSGTTGWLDRMPEIRELCEKHRGAFFYASNFSIGVNIFFELNRHLAKMMNEFPEYGIQVEEIHHTQKLDAPSGTAITLAEGIIDQIDSKQNWVNEQSDEPGELSIISKREENVPGTHLITYRSEIDTLEIKHTAHSREGFAKGAVSAANWIIGKRGCFGMKELLGF